MATDEYDFFILFFGEHLQLHIFWVVIAPYKAHNIFHKKTCLNKQHKSPTMQKYHTNDNCESEKFDKQKNSLFLQLTYLGNVTLQIEKKIWQFTIENLSTKF